MISKNKILSLICLYYPENFTSLNNFINNLSEYSDVLIILNGGKIPENIKFPLNVFIMNDGINYGTLNAYNAAIKHHNSYEFYWLWNQDTDIPNESLRRFIIEASLFFEASESASAITIYDPKNFTHPLQPGLILFKESTTLLRKISVEQCTGYWFDESFFMDCGDWDLALRIYKGGGYIKQLSKITYQHQLGDPEDTIFGPLSRPSEVRLFMQGINFYRYLFIYHRFDFITFLLIVRTFFVLPFKNFLFKNSFRRNLIYFKGIVYGYSGKSSVDWIKSLNKI
jgi:GT2 family glycosyltransferase